MITLRIMTGDEYDNCTISRLIQHKDEVLKMKDVADVVLFDAPNQEYLMISDVYTPRVMMDMIIDNLKDQFNER